jgi:hypothetical protein
VLQRNRSNLNRNWTLVLTLCVVNAVCSALPESALAADPVLTITKQSECINSDEAHKYLIVTAGEGACKAAMAIYVNAAGELMWFESVQNDRRRIIYTIPQLSDTQSGCGQPACTVCVGSGAQRKCGCTC